MRRVLLLTYYFPPSGGSGVQRILKFAKYLPEFGWQPTVLTVRPDRAAYPDLDSTLASDVPSSVKVVRTFSWDPFSVYARLRGIRREDTIGIGFVKDSADAARLQKFGLWLRANVFVPDARIGWVPFAVRAGGRLLRTGEYTAILSTGPPHSVHLVGYRLHRRFNVPWIVDMRDPWSDIMYNRKLPRSSFARRIDERLERRVLESARAVVTVSASVLKGLLTKAPIEVAAVIANGYDPADVVRGVTAPRKKDEFVIAHVGTLTSLQHSPALVRALVDLEHDMNFVVRFVGHVDQSIVAAYREAGLSDRVTIIPYVSHPDAIAHMQAADLLAVSVGFGDYSLGIVPAKTFEYLAVGKPVLGIGLTQGDLSHILSKTGGGAFFSYDDVDGIKKYIWQQAARVRRGLPPERADAKALMAFDRRSLTGRLARILDSLVLDGDVSER